MEKILEDEDNLYFHADGDTYMKIAKFKGEPEDNKLSEETAQKMAEMFSNAARASSIAMHELDMAFCQGRVNLKKQEGKNPQYWVKKLKKAESKLKSFNQIKL